MLPQCPLLPPKLKGASWIRCYYDSPKGITWSHLEHRDTSERSPRVCIHRKKCEGCHSFLTVFWLVSLCGRAALPEGRGARCLGADQGAGFLESSPWK